MRPGTSCRRLVSGPIGDRFGLARVITGCSIVYGVGLLAGGLARTWHDWYLPVVFFVALFGGSVMTLAWGLLFKLMPPGDRGAISGLATTTKGLGLLIGPLLAGGLIDILRPHLQATEGYQVLWPVLGVPILLAIPLVASLIAAEGRSAAARAPRRRPGRSPRRRRRRWRRSIWTCFPGSSIARYPAHSRVGSVP